MTLRICVAGTSHIAALKQADRDGWGASNGVDLVFFGTIVPLYHLLKVEHGVLKGSGEALESLRRTSENRYEAINPDDFDAVVFYGADLLLSRLVLSIAQSSAGRRVRFSEAFLREGIESWVRGLVVFRQIQKLAGPRRKVVLVAATPYPVKAHAEESGLPEDELARLRVKVEAIVAEVFRGVGVEFVSQPVETFAEDGFHTRRRFQPGAVELLATGESRLRKVDRYHMNSEFAVAMLAEIVRRIL